MRHTTHGPAAGLMNAKAELLEATNWHMEGAYVRREPDCKRYTVNPGPTQSFLD